MSHDHPFVSGPDLARRLVSKARAAPENNPLAGGPDFVRILSGLITGAHGLYSRPPATGGSSTSIRLPRERSVLLDLIAGHSGWNRTQVIYALLERGLLELFGELPNQLTGSLMEELAERLAKE